MMARLGYAILAVALVVFIALISDPDPEGLHVGPDHLEWVLELERQEAARARP